MKKISSKKVFSFMGMAVLGLGATMAVLDGKSSWIGGWLGYAIILGIAALAILGTWKMVEGDRSVGVAAITAFSIRLILGIFFMMVLPAAGYQDNPASQLGYLYKDAFIRDQQAWSLAASENPLLDAFSGTYSGDQYGGLLWLSALVYRYLGFGDHRPWLVILLTAMVSGMGVLWLWKAAREWLGGEDQPPRPLGKWEVSSFIPITAAWILALYPESVFLGAAHMREPFVIACIALALYSLTQVQKKPRSWWVGFVLAVAVLFFFQLPASLAVIVVSVGLLLLAYGRRLSWKTALFITAILGLGVILVVWNWQNLPSLAYSNPLNIFTTWLQNNFGFQSYLAERQSGMVQKLMQGAGKQWSLPIILVYGFAQPVLPATIVDPAAPFWRIFNILRSLGWYILAFLLIYHLVAVFSPETQPQRTNRIWLSLVVFAWILIAAANAGGDMWDNPRYRVMFLPYQALLAAFSLWWAFSHKSPWLWRWLAVEVVFVLAFLEWYISRLFPAIPHLSIWIMIGLTLAACGLILAGGWLVDLKKKNQAR
jgi:4-amino-4-deoxy-L-arabinose transferase-like glycosyltransferase